MLDNKELKQVSAAQPIRMIIGVLIYFGVLVAIPFVFAYAFDVTPWATYSTWAAMMFTGFVFRVWLKSKIYDIGGRP